MNSKHLLIIIYLLAFVLTAGAQAQQKTQTAREASIKERMPSTRKIFTALPELCVFMEDNLRKKDFQRDFKQLAENTIKMLKLESDPNFDQANQQFRHLLFAVTVIFFQRPEVMQLHSQNPERKALIEKAQKEIETVTAPFGWTFERVEIKGIETFHVTHKQPTFSNVLLGSMPTEIEKVAKAASAEFDSKLNDAEREQMVKSKTTLTRAELDFFIDLSKLTQDVLGAPSLDTNSIRDAAIKKLIDHVGKKAKEFRDVQKSFFRAKKDEAVEACTNIVAMIKHLQEYKNYGKNYSYE